MEPDEVFHGRTQSFLSWFASVPGSHLHGHLTIHDFRDRNAGRGIVATEDIKADSELFRIPRSAVITVENSALNKAHPHFFDDLEGEHVPQLVDASDGPLPPGQANGADVDDEDDGGEPLDPWLKLILPLIYEHHEGSASQWQPYLDVLPTKFETPMFWTQDELAQLQGSSLLDRIGKAAAGEMFSSKLIPIIRSHSSIFKAASAMSDAEIVNLAHRFGSTIMAYAFDLQKDDDEHVDDAAEDGWTEDREGQQLGMVPMADMLNADAEFNAHLNHEDDALVMVSLRDIEKGEEVLNYYGPLPNSDLLRRYGYVSEKHQVHDVAELGWNLVLDAVKNRFKLDDAVIRDAQAKMDDEEIEDSFVLEYDPIVPDSAGRLPSEAKSPTVSSLPEGLISQLKHFLKVLRKMKPSFEFHELDIYSIVRDALEAQSARSRAVIEPNEAAWRHFEGRTQGEARENIEETRHRLRKAMAFTVRQGETQVLHALLRFVDNKIAELERQNGQPERKRVKTR